MFHRIVSKSAALLCQSCDLAFNLQCIGEPLATSEELLEILTHLAESIMSFATLC